MDIKRLAIGSTQVSLARLRKVDSKVKLKKENVNEVFKEISLWKDASNICVGVLSNKNKYIEVLKPG